MFNYTNDQIKWLQEQPLYLNYMKLTKLFNETFNAQQPIHTIKYKCQRLGLYRIRTKKKFVWLDEHREFLAQYDKKIISYPRLAELFNEKFNANVTDHMVRHQMRKVLGLNIVNAAQFQKGCSPAGTRMIGSIRKKGGKPFIKYRDIKCQPGKSFETNWMPLSRYNYQKYHGAIPEGHRIICLNGDKNDCSKENLIAVPIRCIGAFRRLGWENINDPELRKVAYKMCELKVLINDHLKRGSDDS